ncbi:MAG: hypothetical protein WAV28_09420 [Sedimentisphaerales bacterium]
MAKEVKSTLIFYRFSYRHFVSPLAALGRNDNEDLLGRNDDEELSGRNDGEGLLG